MLKLSGKPPKTLGVKDGKLAKCSWKPNCVCSQYQEDEKHYISPIDSRGSVEATWGDLIKLISQDESAQIKQQNSQYLHVEYSSRGLGFVDDVEFLASPEESVIHVRSASRLGIRDFGVNRRRIEDIKARI